MSIKISSSVEQEHPFYKYNQNSDDLARRAGSKIVWEIVMSGCDPGSIIKGRAHKHSLLCDHKAYYDHRRNKVMYLDGDEFHENCADGHDHTHRSQVCLKHEFTKVAKPDEDCSQRDDCHVHIREDGIAELHHPSENGEKDQGCKVITEFRPIN